MVRMDVLTMIRGALYRMKLIRKHWFLFSLMVTLAIGFLFAQPLAALSNIEWLQWTIVIVTMFLMSWPLALGDFKKTLSRPAAPILACTLNMVVIPLLIWPLAALAGIELGPGMIVAAATPSTLASAAVLTRYAGGDDGVAIIVTIITNASCFLVLPFWILMQTGNELDSGQFIGTIYKLFFFVVLPIAAAQIARTHRSSAAWAVQRKPLLSSLALVGILAMVLLGAIKMGLRLSESENAGLGFRELLIAATVLLGVHLFVFWGGIWIARKMGDRMGISREEQIAVGFSGSQKTLMIGLTTAVNLGISIIPIVLYHSMQLIADSIFAERFREETERKELVEKGD